MDGLEMNSNPDDVVVPLRDNPGRNKPSPIGSSWLSRYETYSGMGSASISAFNAARSSSSDGCGGTYMTAKPGHARVRESSMGISGIGRKLDIVGVACTGIEGPEMGGTGSTSLGCGCSGEEVESSGTNVMVDRSEMAS